jgi:glycosyltransferase involved in cell wall biosynthesis
MYSSSQNLWSASESATPGAYMRPSELWILDDARIMGGGQLFALRLARYVRDERGDASVRLVCPASSELARRARALNIPVTPMDFSSPAALPLVAARAVSLRRWLRGHDDALIVAGSARCQAVAAAAGTGSRLVHLMHEQESAARASVALVHRHVGRVVATGAGAGAAYGAPALCNFLLDEDFDRLARVPARPRDGTLGVLGRLIPEKGVLELIGELGALGAAGGWRRLLVAGPIQDHAYAARVRAAADHRVELLGEIPDQTDLLARIDALVVPSVGHEGQPTVIIEALAAGRPVVVREPINTPDFAGLPVFEYGDLQEALGAALGAPAPDPVLIRGRFGAAQALAVIEGRAP